MKVLLVGSGGREHCLAWKMSQSPLLKRLYVAPGNAGTGDLAENVDIPVEDLVGLVDFASSEGVDLTVVGPEVPLSMGLVDRLNAAGLQAFGPSRDAARLEASKAWAKDFMERNGIPTAGYRVFHRLDEARRYVAGGSGPLVVKADGLAAGKGVVMCQDRDEALDALDFLMRQGGLGDAGQTVVVEEWLQGREASFLAICDGYRIVPMPPARDHKRIYEGNRGPNTGGMGAYCPLPDWTGDLEASVTSIMVNTVESMAKEGIPFKGVLYGGFILTEKGPFVLEFNVRFGDPETQAIIPRLNSDLLEMMVAASHGELGGIMPQWDSRWSVCVAAVSEGYPGRYEKGKAIKGLDAPMPEGVHLFHAGTSPGPVTSGGRVLNVTALGNNLEQAREKAYRALSGICFDGMVYRKDIGRLE